MALSRRNFLRSFLAAPAVVAASSLMPVKLFEPKRYRIKPGVYREGPMILRPSQEELLDWTMADHPWFPPAGLNRGIITPANLVQLPERVYRHGQLPPTVVECEIDIREYGQNNLV